MSPWLVLGCVLPMAIGACLALAFVGNLAFRSKVDRWDRESPLVCGFQERLLIEDVEAHVTGGPVIQAANACQVTIRNSRLEGPVIVRAGSGNVRIIVENSTLVASNKAIWGAGGMRLRVTGDSIIHGRTAAVYVENRGSFDLLGGSLTSDHFGILAGNSLRVSMRNFSIEGGEVGIRAGFSPNLNATDVTISGSEYAVHFREAAEGRLSNTRMHGPVDFGSSNAIAW